MVPQFGSVNLLFTSIVCAIGLPANAFIVTFNVMDWAKGRSLNSCDHILVALGMSGACYQCTLIGWIYIFVQWKVAQGFLYEVLYLILWCTGCLSSWLITCLSVFYSLKIVDFNHRLFTWLKLRVSKVVPGLLLGSVLTSIVLFIPEYWISGSDVPLNATNDLLHNNTMPGFNFSQFYTLGCIILTIFVPLVIRAASITLILTSLFRHTRRMKENSSDFSQPRLDVHFGAARMVGCLLLIALSLFLFRCVILHFHSPLSLAILWNIFGCCDSAQSIVLILGTSKLKQNLWKMLSLWRHRGSHQGEKSVKPQ